MKKFNRKLEAIDYQIAFFTTFGLNGAEVAKQLGKNKSTINRRLHNNLLIAEINFRRNQLFDTYAAKYATFAHLALDSGCLLYTSPSPRDATLSRMPSSA